MGPGKRKVKLMANTIEYTLVSRMRVVRDSIKKMTWLIRPR